MLSTSRSSRGLHFDKIARAENQLTRLNGAVVSHAVVHTNASWKSCALPFEGHLLELFQDCAQREGRRSKASKNNEGRGERKHV